MECIDGALTCEKENPRYAYIAPQYKQAKSVAWDYLKSFTRNIIGTKFNENELRCDFPDGGRISLLGADNPDSLRGRYLDGVVLDEMAQMPNSLFGEVIRPTLSDRLGWAVFIGTPKGHNSFYELYNFARHDTSGEWFAAMFKASETKIILQAELDSALAEMGPDKYAQEWECSFSAAITGAYYGKIMSGLEEAGRFTDVLIDPMLPVHTAWDLGMSDSTVIWFFQQMPGGNIRIVDYFEGDGMGLDEYIRILKSKDYLYGTHIAPHDIRVRELGTGKSRLEIARSLGLRFKALDRLPLADGINAVRLLLPKCWFDWKNCEKGIEALRQYHRKYNEKTMIFSTNPEHDWTSHAADGFRSLAVGINHCMSDNFMTSVDARNLYNQYAQPIEG